jgi:hypothetical protein
VVGGLLAALLLGGCSGASTTGGTASGVCDPPTREAVDALSTLHLLPGAPDPAYQTNPPTSGAHRVGLYPRGVIDQPISRPVQVALLEKGSVIVQYLPGTNNATALASLASGNVLVTVAPNSTLPAPIVATAWTWKLTCRSASLAPVEAFVKAHAGQGPGRP